MMSTIKDVARLSKTSIATVSRVINGKTVKEENYSKVKKAMEELNFSVNTYAQSLKTQKSMLVGMIIPDLADVYFMNVAKVIQEKLYQKGYSVLLVDSNRSYEREQEKVELLISKKVDGLIITPVTNKGGYLKKYIEETPIVLLDQLVEDFEIDAVVPENKKCIYQVTKDMIRNGHRRIGFLGGQQILFTAKERYQGYEQAHLDMGIPICETLVQCGTYSEKWGYKATKKFLQMDEAERPTAILATNYDLTKGSVIAIREANVNIPNDLSFVGYDFEDLVFLFYPQLSIIVEPIQNVGEKVVEVLCGKMDRKIDLLSKGIYRMEPTLMKHGSIKRI